MGLLLCRVFFTDNRRPVRDGGGIEPDLPFTTAKVSAAGGTRHTWSGLISDDWIGDVCIRAKEGDSAYLGDWVCLFSN
jgi:hypothetical protein